MVDFLRNHFQGIPDGWITLWAKNNTTGESRTAWYNLQDNEWGEKLQADALRADAAGWDCYFSTCPGSKKKSARERIKADEVIWIPAFFMDIDTMTGSKANAQVPENIETAVDLVRGLEFQPSAIINSGNGIHAYMKLSNPIKVSSPEELQLVTKQMRAFAETASKALGNFPDLDTSASEPARVLRIPGTHNHKREPLPVTVIELTGQTYPLNTLTSWAGAIEQRKPFKATPENDRFELPAVIGEGGRNNMLHKYGLSRRSYGATDQEVETALYAANRDRCRPSLPESEVRTIIRSVCSKDPGNVLRGTGKGGGVIIKQKAETDADHDGSGDNVVIPDLIINGLERDPKGNILKTVDNFLLIMQGDPFYEGVKYNELSYAPEIMDEGKPRKWTDADDANSIHHIERAFHLYHRDKHEIAFKRLLEERKYHPIKNIIDALTWDGKPRINDFLIKWMGALDDEYSREVSRLIFAGGIHRLYNPGCKFDIMPVLIGKNQGEGKSTIVRWLAIKDDYFAEAVEIESQRSVEQLDGAWIVEMGELLAITKAREVEAVKSYISRQVDRYRAPYERRLTSRDRSCIFIGTTNSKQFLTDKTGNRRFFPVLVNSTGRYIFKHEKEIKSEILQCWAEARAKMLNNTLQPVENYKLADTIRAAQSNAVEDDWREGRILAYLETLTVGTRVCIHELRKFALYPGDDRLRDDKRESRQLGLFMDRVNGWSECPKKVRSSKLPDLGPQRCWEKENSFVMVGDDEDFLP